jgi:hypothetical protein
MDALEPVWPFGFVLPGASKAPVFVRSLLGDHGLKVARPAGLEPATIGLEGRCSIQLS